MPFTIIQKICGYIQMRGLRHDQRGAMAVFVGLGLFALVGATGVAVDMSRLQTVRARLSSALDAAGLAAGAKANSEEIQDVARNYLDVNFPAGFMNATITSMHAVANADNTVITLDATANVQMTFMKVFGVTSWDITANSEITRENRGLEIVMALDVTGSMAGTKITNLRTAATTMVNILFGDHDSLENLWVSVVPYVTAVNIGTNNSAWLTTANVNSLYPAGYPASATKWKGCVEARSQNPTAYPGLDISDEPPYLGDRATATAEQLATLFPPYFWATTPQSFTSNNNPWLNPSNGNVSLNENAGYSDTNARGPNIGCGTPITPFTSQKATVQAAVDALVPWRRGGTMSSEGMAWAWRVISPRWRGFWNHESADLPLDYHTPLMNKAVIIMTDGVNEMYDGRYPYLNSDYSSYGHVGQQKLGAGVDTKTEGVTAVNTRFAALCQAMKDEGIIIYTVTFQLGTNTASNNARTMFRTCATHPDYYFDSPDGAALENAFQQIGDSLANLMISH